MKFAKAIFLLSILLPLGAHAETIDPRIYKNGTSEWDNYLGKWTSGSQMAAATLLLPLTLFSLPPEMPGIVEWAALIALGVLCTGIAYALYFRLLTRVGPTKAMAVTFLVPAFAIFWGALLLAEDVTWVMLGGCAVILLGTSLATQLIARRR